MRGQGSADYGLPEIRFTAETELRARIEVKKLPSGCGRRLADGNGGHGNARDCRVLQPQHLQRREIERLIRDDRASQAGVHVVKTLAAVSQARTVREPVIGGELPAAQAVVQLPVQIVGAAAGGDFDLS